jgi:putative transposase
MLSEEIPVKKSKFSDSQIIGYIKRAEVGEPVPALCREGGFSAATFYKWRSKYGGMDVSMMARVKELEEENRRLKKMYAESQMDAAILKEALGKKW